MEPGVGLDPCVSVPTRGCSEVLILTFALKSAVLLYLSTPAFLSFQNIVLKACPPFVVPHPVILLCIYCCKGIVPFKRVTKYSKSKNFKRTEVQKKKKISNCIVWVESETEDMDRVANGQFVPETISLW